jgi:hypothetical protein
VRRVLPYSGLGADDRCGGENLFRVHTMLYRRGVDFGKFAEGIFQFAPPIAENVEFTNPRVFSD